MSSMPSDQNNVHPIQPSVPPRGDEAKGEKYIQDLINLIDNGKIQVHKTDLSQFNPSALQSHYRVDLDDFQIEISHSSHLETGANSFVIIFNNLKNIADGNTEKAILAYIHLTEIQYQRFLRAAENQLEKLRKIEDEKRFIRAVQPLDDKLAAIEESNRDIFQEKLDEVKRRAEVTPQAEVQPAESTEQPQATWTTPVSDQNPSSETN